jgi:hypothetical protein
MSVFLFLLGLAMMVIGLAAIYSGSLFVGIERGWTMVVAGSIGFSAGAILLGIGAVLRRLKRIEKATKRLAGGLFSLVQPGSEASAEVPAILQAIAEPPLAAVSPSVAAKATEPEAAGSAPEPDRGPEPALLAPDKVVGTYQAGGCSYVMFADGSIRAQTPSGEHRFTSMDEFKAFMLTGSVRRRPAEPPARVEPQKPQADVAVSDSPTTLSAKA